MKRDGILKAISAVGGVLALFLAVGVAADSAFAQDNLQSSSVRVSVPPDTILYRVDPIIVTATRTAREVSEVPKPVSVVDQARIREQLPNTVTDLFRGLVGLDVVGVGVTQARPIIRGQRGQRILLLQDGMRMNNSRRQSDFGGLPSLVDVSGVERVEIVRGPASVLYGSDAIGGVVNIITQTPVQEGIHGTVDYRYGNIEGQDKGSAQLFGRFGAWDFQGRATVRDVGEYTAPSGSFGDITLGDDVTVHDTGVEDQSYDFRLGYRASDRHTVFGKVERYSSENSGFGYVAPEDFAPDEAFVQILYPTQDFTKFTAGYSGIDLGTPVADRFDFTAYYQRNERELGQNIAIEFFPGAGMEIASANFTDVSTTGLRLEAKKLIGQEVLLTYGVDLFRDKSENSDSTVTTITGFGPEPMVETNTAPSLPYASYRSVGAYAQGEVEIGPRLTIIGGARFQDVNAESKRTPGLDNTPVTRSNSAVVGAFNAIFDITDDVSVIGSVGRAFRAPNLIEIFFDGPTPEGSGYQTPNSDLEPETSLNLDAGIRYTNSRVALEAFYFHNTINDGIRVEERGDSIGGLPAFWNVNVDELLYTGVELSGEVYLPYGISVASSFTHMSQEDVHDANNPIAEAFSTKVNGSLRYRHPGNRFWGEWEVRHNGEQKDVDLGTSPIGDVLPGFTVHNLRGGVTVIRTESGQTGRVGIAVTNLTDELYSEFLNASFFRPEPGRNVTITLGWTF